MPRQALVIRSVCAFAVLSAVMATYRYFDVGNLLTIGSVKVSASTWVVAFHDYPVVTALGFFGLYTVVTAISVPGAAILTIAAGAIFGFYAGLLIVSFASSLGALCAFSAARYLLRDLIKSRFRTPLNSINAGLERDGALYLLTLRLTPVFPFWLVNLLMGLTQISAARFYLVSQAGMLLGSAVYVNAGTQLMSINSSDDILSPGLLAGLFLLGSLPIAAKFIADWMRVRKVYSTWRQPSSFDRNLVVIGAGAGGLVSAYIAAAAKAKVTLIERHAMGGDCLNFGCVPSKALIRSAKMAKQLKTAQTLGFEGVTGSVDFTAVMERVRNVIQKIAPHDSVERYTALGIEVLQGHARIVDPWNVEVTFPDGRRRTISTRSIVLATGARPFVPPIPGLSNVNVLTSDTIWELKELPQRLVVLGGGPIGCELAQCFARLGSQVTLFEMAPRIMIREDAEVSQLVEKSLREDGVTVLSGHQAVRAEILGDSKYLVARKGEQEISVPFDGLLCAVGRSPRVAGYGLEELGIRLTPRGSIETNAHQQTLYPNIYAVGDVAGPFQFTHTAAHQAWYAAVNSLFGRYWKFKTDNSVIPWATFTDPEVARVGLSENEASEQGVAYEVSKYGLSDLDRAIADETAHGFIKVLTVPGKDKILGVTIVGEHAADLIIEYVLAMKHKIGLNKILGTIHIYPTLAEANKHVAGEWRRAHVPQNLLVWAERFHSWERS